MQPRRTHSFVLGSGIPVEIREIIPSDFFAIGGPPFSFITPKRIMTMHEQVVGASDDIDSEQLTKVFKHILGAGVVSYNDEPFDVEEYFLTDNVSDAFELYSAILKLSLIFFSDLKMYEIDKDFSNRIDIVAKRYGKTPAEIILGSTDHTDLDAWFFNFSIGLSEYSDDINDKAKGAVVI